MNNQTKDISKDMKSLLEKYLEMVNAVAKNELLSIEKDVENLKNAFQCHMGENPKNSPPSS